MPGVYVYMCVGGIGGKKNLLPLFRAAGFFMLFSALKAETG